MELGIGGWGSGRMLELPSVKMSKVGGKMNVVYEKHSIISAKQMLNY
jgi:hypothetical protein